MESLALAFVCLTFAFICVLLLLRSAWVCVSSPILRSSTLIPRGTCYVFLLLYVICCLFECDSALYFYPDPTFIPYILYRMNDGVRVGDTVDTHAPHDDVTTFLLLVTPRFETPVRPWLLRFSEMVFASVDLLFCLVIFGFPFAILVLHYSLYHLIYSSLTCFLPSVS